MGNGTAVRYFSVKVKSSSVSIATRTYLENEVLKADEKKWPELDRFQ